MRKGFKIALGVAGIIVGAFVLFNVFSGGSNGGETTGLVSGNSSQPIVSNNQSVLSGGGAEIGQEFISMLLNLQAINLDTTLFQEQSFLSLKNNSIEFRDPGGQGRPNPFAPIGSDAISENPTPQEDPLPEELAQEQQPQNNDSQPGGTSGGQGNPFEDVDA
jgi:hypothetical protein